MTDDRPDDEQEHYGPAVDGPLQGTMLSSPCEIVQVPHWVSGLSPFASALIYRWNGEGWTCRVH